MPIWRTAARRAGRSVLAAATIASVLAPMATRALADTPAATTHVVQPGETLSDIAATVGVDSATLVALNSLEDANVLSVGQSIKLPGKSPASVPAPAPGPVAPPSAAVPAAATTAATSSSPGTYTIAAGDTLWAVAQRLATTTAALADANHLDDPDHLIAGTQLAVPNGAAGQATQPPPSAAPAPAPVSSPGPAAAAGGATPKRTLLVSYTVQAGETLSQIAHQFEVPADAIAQASGLDDPNRLPVGSVLQVPLPGREHVVQAGETLRDIAAQEKVDLGSLVDFNALDDPSLIHIGQVVLVPAAANGQTAASNDPPATKPAAAAPAAAVATPAPGAAAPAQSPPDAPAAAPAAAAASTVASAAPPASATAAPAASAAAASPAAAAPAAPHGSPAVKPASAQKPAAPVAVVAPPAGSPSDGLVGAGLKLLGSPYVWGGSSPSGFDCSGFVWYVARQAGKQLSRGMLGEYNAGAHLSRDELKPGDLVFFQNTYSAGLSHNGIFIGNGKFVHAADEAAGVTISSLGTAYWSSHWFGATRLP